MSKIADNLHEMSHLYDLQQRDLRINRLHPLVKTSLNIFYIILVVSINKYELDRMLLMAVYLFIAYAMADLSVKDALSRVKLILPLVLAVGIFNPLLDHHAGLEIGSFMISAGWISMLSLMCKGIFTVLAAYLLIATTSMEEICYSFRLVHVPKLLVTVFLLTYRYIVILGEEADRITTAYHLRAPSQKGINYKVWGPLVGQWMLRSFDRAERIYQAMVLRGFTGEFPASRDTYETKTGILYLTIWTLVLLGLRLLPILP